MYGSPLYHAPISRPHASCSSPKIRPKTAQKPVHITVNVQPNARRAQPYQKKTHLVPKNPPISTSLAVPPHTQLQKKKIFRIPHTFLFFPSCPSSDLHPSVSKHASLVVHNPTHPMHVRRSRCRSPVLTMPIMIIPLNVLVHGLQIPTLEVVVNAAFIHKRKSLKVGLHAGTQRGAGGHIRRCDGRCPGIQ